MEAFKWHDDEPQATLVTAEMEWTSFSVRSFRTYRVSAGGERELVAELETSADGAELVARIGGELLRCPRPRIPWHSYDFDFASLNVALRFLVDPKGEVELAIVDPVQSPDGPALAFKGTVRLRYEEDETYAGSSCRRYSIDGQGLEHRGGKIWATRGDEIFFVGFEIDLPDEPGMSSGRLEWIESATHSPEEWQRFQRERKLKAR